jgi:hypothetical protein
MAGTRNYQSIGEVLVNVKTEFPDITISRSASSSPRADHARAPPSGYRKFYPEDVERLKSILRLQRDEYLPLKVIRSASSRRTPETRRPAHLGAGRRWCGA